ncbi:hypothetical protein JVT61DRAFT_12461 [Boletus reticuloceps]|uniref:Uncharacterized protein n=1 Tax=Boletus reticuloceps TaxID=495285 RepID=A0A8I2YDR5_9AGAM|nr:hypothetical protein JVT61DRAFT_12461 [Boletus reticuloceps]
MPVKVEYFHQADDDLDICKQIWEYPSSVLVCRLSRSYLYANPCDSGVVAFARRFSNQTIRRLLERRRPDDADIGTSSTRMPCLGPSVPGWLHDITYFGKRRTSLSSRLIFLSRPAPCHFHGIASHQRFFIRHKPLVIVASPLSDHPTWWPTSSATSSIMYSGDYRRGNAFGGGEAQTGESGSTHCHRTTTFGTTACCGRARILLLPSRTVEMDNQSQSAISQPSPSLLQPPSPVPSSVPIVSPSDSPKPAPARTDKVVNLLTPPPGKVTKQAASQDSTTAVPSPSPTAPVPLSIQAPTNPPAESRP